MITSTIKAGGRSVLKIHQDIVNLETGEAFKNALNHLFLNGEKEIVLDFSEVRLINSHGVGKILMFFKKFKKAGGRIFVTGLQGSIREIFESLLLTRILPEIDSAGAGSGAGHGKTRVR